MLAKVSDVQEGHAASRKRSEWRHFDRLASLWQAERSRPRWAVGWVRGPAEGGHAHPGLGADARPLRVALTKLMCLAFRRVAPAKRDAVRPEWLSLAGIAPLTAKKGFAHHGCDRAWPDAAADAVP